jgi:hypothetical protein
MTAGNALAMAIVDENLRLDFWLACRAVPGLNAERWRYDHAGLLMKWDEFGNSTSKVGWQLAYIVAPAAGGADHEDNLRAVSFASLPAADQGTAG